MLYNRMSTPDLILGLERQQPIVSELLKMKKPYCSFLVNLMKIINRPREDKLRVKNIAVEIKISAAKIRKNLVQIYNDIDTYWRDNERKPIKLGAPIVHLWVCDTINRYAFISNMEFDVIPRVGESIELQILFPIFWYPYFVVKEIRHAVDYGEHQIHIELSSKYNKYIELKKDELEYNRDKKYYDDKLEYTGNERYFYFKDGEWKESI